MSIGINGDNRLIVFVFRCILFTDFVPFHIEINIDSIASAPPLGGGGGGEPL